MTASVAPVCSITATPVAFGTYDPVNANLAANLNATGAVAVNCTKGTVAAIDLGNGLSFSGGTRRMSSGLDFLGYALYKDAARTQVWGSGVTGGSAAAYVALNKNTASLTVYGTIPQAQDVTVGSYSDTVIATINY